MSASKMTSKEEIGQNKQVFKVLEIFLKSFKNVNIFKRRVGLGLGLGLGLGYRPHVEILHF